ncbi:hypothetical protein BCR44DRAFT_70745 [Catenaria anguillulae PL171]|uniref:Uncharacterized protein n=1 Tax=Catenaria anguillulae PL171 TaxID=765915 RepID=A0A1Y2HMC3_9FUNG|nr:hypothetical protein BCR44DRAFT_70745 [Catenaria anguillulae PL171]
MDTPPSQYEPNALYYWDDKSPGQGGRPVAMADLFPLFANDRSAIAKSPRLCRSDYTSKNECSEVKESVNSAVLDQCMTVKCLKQLEAVSRHVTVDQVIAASGREKPDTSAQLFTTEFFNAVGVVEDCKIRHCPTEFFNARSFHCLPLFGPYLYDRKMYIPRHQIDGSGEAVYLHQDYLSILRNNTQSIESIRASMESVTGSDAVKLGICVPTLPIGHACDPKGVDPVTGALIPPSSTGDQGFGLTPKWNPLWMYKMDKVPALTYPHDESSLTTEVINQNLLTTPVNMYTLGHCPSTTGAVAASKLGGQPCASSIECVFGVCTGGVCSEAALGKKLDKAKASEIVLDSRIRAQDRINRAEGIKWTMVAAGLLGGLLVLRVLREVYVRWMAAKAKKARE